MVIGLDIDGTITRHPEFFAFLSQTFVRGGHQVVVITFREDQKSAAEDLAAWGVAYSKVVTWSFQKNGGEEMDAWKGRICEAMCVDVLFEDDPVVLRHVSRAVVSMMVVDHDNHDLSRLADDTSGRF